MTIIQANSPQALKAELDRFIATAQPQATSSDLTNLYATAPAVYAASNYRANNVAAVKMIVKDDKGNVLPPDHVAVRPFERDYYQFMFRSELANYFWGRNLLYKQRNLLNKPMALRWVNPNLYQLDTTSSEGLRRFRIMRGGYNYENVTDGRYIERQDAVYQHGVDFGDDYDGVSEAEVAFLAGGMSVEMATTVLAFFRNRAIPAAIAQPLDKDSKASEEDKNALVAFLRRTFMGAINAGRTLVSRSRWEWITLQQNFDDLAMPELIKNAREDVFLVSGVPMVLLISGASSYAEFEGARRSWLQNWLVPRLWWYASAFTEQLTREFGNYTVEPDLNAIPGLKEDAATRTNVVNAQVQGGYLTLYDAQKANELEPDEALEGFYLINGVLYHRNQLNALKQPTTPLQLDTLPPTPATQDAPAQAPQQVDDTVHVLPPRPKSAGYVLSDEVFTELKNWQHVSSRKGAKHAFECRYVRVDVEERLVARLAEAAEPEAMRAAFAYARELSAQKAIQATRLDFEAAFNNVLEGGRAADYTRQQFQSQLRKVLRQYGTMAYRDGLIDGGVIDGEMDDEDRADLATLHAEQNAYISDFGATLFKDGITDTLADLKAELWWNKSVYKFYQRGLASADRNGMYEWVLGQTEQHCLTCAALAGQVHRMKEYAKRDLLPKSSRLACGGWYCDCNLVKTNQRSRGTFPRVAASSDGHEHDHDHAHEHGIDGEPDEPIAPDEFEHFDAVDGDETSFVDDSDLIVPPDEIEKRKNDDEGDTT